VAGPAARSGSAAGQHFLRSSRFADELVRAALVAPGDAVLDIGAGRGALTRALARAGADVVAVERDPRLAAELRRAGFRVLEVDAVSLPWPREPFSVVANLPFAITTALLGRLLGDPRVPLRRADVIVQLGFALKRTAAWPSTLQGVLWSATYELSIARRIDRSAFAPPPGVDAALLRVVQRPTPLVRASDFAEFAAFVRSGFRQGSRPPIDRRLALEHGLSRRAAARDLAPEQWAALFHAVHPNR
jgi:23S rRNA (adenine-N6)-dimethyltransferase